MTGTDSRRIESGQPGHASVAQQSQRASRAFGFVSLGLSTLAIICLAKARTTTFVHGNELVWGIAYLVPLVLSIAALICAIGHVVRRRFAGIFAWLPVALSLPVASWLVAYLFFDAFRNP